MHMVNKSWIYNECLGVLSEDNVSGVKGLIPHPPAMWWCANQQVVPSVSMCRKRDKDWLCTLLTVCEGEIIMLMPLKFLWLQRSIHVTLINQHSSNVQTYGWWVQYSPKAEQTTRSKCTLSSFVWFAQCHTPQAWRSTLMPDSKHC